MVKKISVLSRKCLRVEWFGNPFFDREGRLVFVVIIFFLENFDHCLQLDCAQHKVIKSHCLVSWSVTVQKGVDDGIVQNVSCWSKGCTQFRSVEFVGVVKIEQLEYFLNMRKKMYGLIKLGKIQICLLRLELIFWTHLPFENIVKKTIKFVDSQLSRAVSVEHCNHGTANVFWESLWICDY